MSCYHFFTCTIKITFGVSHLLIEAITKFRNAALNFIKLAALLSSVSLDDVHGGDYAVVSNNNVMVAMLMA